MADGRLRDVRERLGEWFLRRQALAAARAQLPRADELAARAYEQARLLREVTRQVAEPADELPPGRVPAVMLSLCRDLVYWTLMAQRKNEAGAPADVAAVWAQTPPERLLRAAGDGEALEAVRRTLIDLSPRAALDATDADVARARAFADDVYRDLELPRRRVDRLLVLRWLSLIGSAAGVLVLVLVVRALALGPDLAAGSSLRPSSTWPGCADDEKCRALMFHTVQEFGPWVEFDLGAPKKIRSIEADNRLDCCQERAVPLLAEVSNDRVNWREVGRRDTVFSTWTLKLPPTVTRYVRLRVPKTTMFHLKSVAIR